MIKKVIAVIISLVLAIAVSFNAFSLENNALDSVKSAVEGVLAYKSADLNASSTTEFLDRLSKNAGDFSSDWYYIALSRYGVNCESEKSITALKDAVEDFYNEGLASVKVTDLQRVALALLACNQDITNVNSRNLLADATYNRPAFRPLDAQGVNSLSYALILLDTKNYSIPKGKTITREKLVSDIMDKELENGGYALFGKGLDVDITAIVLQALAPYKNRSKVKESINRCLNLLSKRQDESGAYKSFSNQITAESTAQVVMAVTALGINPLTDSRFIKNGKTLLDGLNEFKLSGGGYCHMQGYEVNNIATYQSFCALVSVYRFLSGGSAFFDFSDKQNDNTQSVDKAVKKTVKKHSAGKKSPEPKTNKSKNNSVIKNIYNSKLENKTVKTKRNNSKTEKTKKISDKKNKITNKKTESEIVVINESQPIKKSEKKHTPEGTPLYIDSIILIIGYVIVFAVKSGGKE